MDPRGLRVTQNAYFSLLTLTKKLLLATFCHPTAETGVNFRTHGRTDARRTEEGQTDVEVKIVSLDVRKQFCLFDIQFLNTVLESKYRLSKNTKEY